MRSYEAVIAAFEALNAKDYNFDLGEYETQDYVRQLCEELKALPAPERALPVLFAVFERIPDGDFGTPGALVFTVEGLSGYESELRASLGRQPTSYTVWMVNRILNNLFHKEAPPEHYQPWLLALQKAVGHPLAANSLDPKTLESASEKAQDYLDFQARQHGLIPRPVEPPL